MCKLQEEGGFAPLWRATAMSKITGNEIEALNLRNKHIADELNKFFSDKKKQGGE